MVDIPGIVSHDFTSDGMFVKYKSNTLSWRVGFVCICSRPNSSTMSSSSWCNCIWLPPGFIVLFFQIMCARIIILSSAFLGKFSSDSCKVSKPVLGGI